MRNILFIVAIGAALFMYGCNAPNKFCKFEAFGMKKCLQLDNELTEDRCKQIGGVPAKDCGEK